MFDVLLLIVHILIYIIIFCLSHLLEYFMDKKQCRFSTQNQKIQAKIKPIFLLLFYS